MNTPSEFEEILRLALKKGASDVHLKAGIMPVIRKHGALRPLAPNLPPLTGEKLQELAYSFLNKNQRELLNDSKEVDLGFGISGLGRFRINVFKQRGTIRIVVRNIPHKVPGFEDLSLPEKVREISQLERGLVLVTGITGSGKSSTLAAMVDEINRKKNKHILTIEDPIEFLIRDKKSIITQRELGIDSLSFSKALRAALRQDPDVILIGEMRDRETIEIALLAAETGHLVLSTLHTLDATESINRIVAAFESHQQSQIRYQLASVLKAVISQRLAKRADGQGFAPAVEIMVNNERIREMIMKQELTGNIREAIQQGQVPWGMQSFDQSLMDLLLQEKIGIEEALSLTHSPEDFKIRLQGVTSMDGKKWADNTQHRAHIQDEWQALEEIELDLPSLPQVPNSKKKKSS